VLLVKEETVLQGMNGRFAEIGKLYEMEMDGGKRKITRISKQSSTVQIMIDEKQLENVEYFSSLVSVITSNAKCTRGIKSMIAGQKQHSTRRLFSPANWT